MAAHLTRSAVYSVQWMRPMLFCGMAVKRVGILGVGVRKLKALAVKIAIVTLIDKGR